MVNPLFGLPLKGPDYVVVDTELTGLNERKDSIISVGAVRMRGGRILAGESFYMLVKPGSKMKREGIVIHGIIPSEVVEERSIDEVLSEFHSFCGSDVLVGHCLSIDLGFMDRELKRITGLPVKNQAADTWVLHSFLARRLPSYAERFRDRKDAGLYSMAVVFGIPITGAHNALMDAFITAQVFQRLLPLLEEAGILSLGKLLEAGGARKAGKVFRSSGEICNL